LFVGEGVKRKREQFYLLGLYYLYEHA
jgi:hypothetical protein